MAWRGLVVVLGVLTFLHLYTHSAGSHHQAGHHTGLVATTVDIWPGGPPALPEHQDVQAHTTAFGVPAASIRAAADQWHLMAVLAPPALANPLEPQQETTIRCERAPPYGHHARARLTNTLTIWRC